MIKKSFGEIHILFRSYFEKIVEYYKTLLNEKFYVNLNWNVTIQSGKSLENNSLVHQKKIFLIQFQINVQKPSKVGI